MKWYIPFESKIFMNLIKNLKSEDSGVSGAFLWAIKREFNKPITECERKVNILFSKLINENISSENLLKYSMSMSWLILLWSFYHLIPKETIFFSKSKFQLNENILNESECMIYSISLASKLLEPINTFLNYCKDDEGNIIFDVIEEAEKKKSCSIDLRRSKENEYRNLLSQVENEKSEEIKKNLIGNAEKLETEIQEKDSEIEAFKSKEVSLDQKLQNRTRLLLRQIKNLQDDSEFKEFNKLNIDIHINNIDKMISIINNRVFDTFNYDVSDGCSFDFAYYFGVLSPYLRKLTYSAASNDENCILLLFLSIYFVKTKQKLSSESNKFKIFFYKIDQSIKIKTLLDDFDAIVLIFYDEKNGEFSLLIVDKETNENEIQIYYYYSYHDISKNIANQIEFIKEKFETEDIICFIKRIYVTNSDINNKNKNIYLISSIIRQVFTNQLNFDDCTTITIDQFNENLMILVEDLNKQLERKPSNDLYDPCMFFSSYREIMTLTDDSTFDKIKNLYEEIYHKKDLINFRKKKLKKIIK